MKSATTKTSALKQYREAAGLSQAALGAAVGRHPSSISLAERGAISRDMARRCATALGCAPCDLLPDRGAEAL